MCGGKKAGVVMDIVRFQLLIFYFLGSKIQEISQRMNWQRSKNTCWRRMGRPEGSTKR